MSNQNLNFDNTNKTQDKKGIYFSNVQVFPKVGTLPNSEKVKFVGHYGSVTKIRYISTKTFPHHMVSIGDDRKICIWNIQTNSCDKIIPIDFFIYDFILADEENLIICGEAIQKIDMVNNTIYYTIKPKIGFYKEYSALTLVNSTLAAASSMNRKVILFEISTGKIVKTILMNNIHYICKLETEKETKKKQRKKKEGEEEVENEQEEEEDEEEEKDQIEPLNKQDSNANSSTNRKSLGQSLPNSEKTKEEAKTKKKKKCLRNIGSANCICTKDNHKGYVYLLLGLNTEEFPNSIISGGDDNIVKITKTDNNEVIDFIGHEDTISAISIMNKKFLLSGSYDRTIRKWNMLSRQCEEIMNKHTAIITIVYPLNDKYLLSSAMDRKIMIWDDNGNCVKTFSFENGTLMTTVKCEEDTFIYGDSKGELFIKKINW